MTAGLLERYRRLLADGKISPDPAQALAVEKLQILTNRLALYVAPTKTDFFSFFTRKRGEVPKGLYVYGAVGRGKTMLMDLFYQEAQVEKKRRAHFHEFMADVHAALTVARRAAKDDPIVSVAKSIAAEARLLCLDELFVTDIADATIVSRLFATLFDAGTVVVFTSNAHPMQLYKNGRNRDQFVPFIHLIENTMEVLQLESAQDYRLQHLTHGALYFTPADSAAKVAMDELWKKLTFGEPCAPEAIPVLGRELHVPRACLGAARFTFAELFQQPTAASDYLALVRHYHTIFVDGIPVLTPADRNAARRFITFIDTLYDARTGFVASADAQPDDLYKAGDGSELFERTASRLIEMRSPDYFTKAAANRETAEESE
ncbi:AFG1-family ATPase [Rhodomicrobium vannielii ATCC 17100]|jgi:cell division protein ZapE|uniref:AFG1-family ATPase n=1 Tax=Rhodomicrobium vannielii (strain ATCC 17100 / DSM 162 / LMG 4299 / NCIMB 10020 / ATH 3.1.1) TaxID=648757 RepID=E3I2X1_RHOVT|nr:cell division protein ZapE [Rhodomicrobium vannielii]ADP72566.1 AFG1-family ATPase [Rhodomicrobium vannielii ATCC 17100]